MDKIQKFLAKLDRKQRSHVLAALRCIAEHRVKDLDIKPLQGHKGHFRCRIGNIRILFCRFGDTTVVYEVHFRGNVYKRR